MRKLFTFASMAIMITVSSCLQKPAGNLVFVKGGTFINTKSRYHGTGVIIQDFYIGQYEVTQKEWTAVMGSNPSAFKGDSLPVESVSWYDCIDYCNKRSLKEGLQPYYHIDRDKNDTITIRKEANGYRLPTEAEWEYAAGGGQMSKGFTYSGGNNPDAVAWYWKNAGDTYLTGAWSWPALVKNNNKTKPAGARAPNEIGLYDMAGNVREWCWDLYDGNGADDPQGRIWKGGGWMGADFCCEPSFRAHLDANGKGPDQGFRVCRSTKPGA